MSSGITRTYEIRKTTENDRENVLNALRRFFFHQIPSIAYFNGVAEDNSVWREFENSTMKDMDDPSWNFVAVDQGKIIGVCLNKEVTKDNYFDMGNATDEGYAKFVKFCSGVRRQTDLFGKFADVDKAFMVSSVGVDEEYRKLGVGLDLVSKSRDLAKELGYKLVTANCANFYAVRIFKKLGFEVAHREKYSYKINDKETIKPSPPHDYSVVVVQRI